ncbi:MAG: 16S rRNA (uracil(1498)-N(3))-methyltransferase [Candidatus Marinimicrobia bacterium]|nr:16S rRNA (uracil(1498)-N(3))-methyltransferase [Candidatus Neomarinimicrobiota bacterium]MBL7010449.1 16S rRNA (uracil(1498)-N(3))-methyltransferase [Candidatus Neomarinimicrobiota bacterium]MBL7030055.1 16S rRNA (uracil(1498)-N(3))-methyltransferase [Candidatus Neomarinimicrobiota bacterium]
MEEHYFYLPSEYLNQNQFTLSKEESQHCLKSLRGKEGDSLWLLDGQGTAYEGTISRINGQSVTGMIQQTYPNYGESDFEIHLAIGLIKGNRMDFVLEKGTELGVKSIQPLLLDRCVKNKLNMDRANRIVISAAKQSGRSFFPHVHDPIDLTHWLDYYRDSHKIVCHISRKKSLLNALGKERKNCCIMIGPEGDFSERELNQMAHAQVDFASLGSRRLRSETAVLMAISNLNQLMGN